MRVVIDANVLIAAYAARGLCEAILELCISNDDIYLTNEILADVREKLIRKIKMPAAQADDVIEFLKNNAIVVQAAPIPQSTCRDPDDENILGAAATARADYIVSGDEDLLVIKQYLGTIILNPRGYWDEFSRKRR